MRTLLSVLIDNLMIFAAGALITLSAVLWLVGLVLTLS